MSRTLHRRESTLLFLLLLCVHAYAQHFRFAQLTDLHLSQGNPLAAEALQQSIRAINAMDSIDFVLVTGDISDTGDRESLMRAKALLDQLQPPYHIVMGNHETKWSASACTAWQEVFGYERFQMTHQGIHFLGFNTGPLMRMAYGHVVRQDLTWMERQLQAWPANEPVIVVTHYPLLDGDVDNWYSATSLLRRYNVRLCIGGHYHQTRTFSYDGLPGILMRSNQYDEAHHPGFGLYTVTPQSILAQVQDVAGECRDVATFPLHTERGEMPAIHYPDSTDNTTYANVRRRWLVQGEASIYSSPAADDKRLYVGDDAGVLTAYRLSDGHRLWSMQTGARIVGTPAVSQGIVVVGSADGCIYAYNSRNGRLRWRVPCQAPVIGAVSIRDGVVYVGASDHTMRALRLRDGAPVWQYTDVDGYIETRPLVTPRHVIFGAWDRCLYCTDRQTGRLTWKWEVPRPSILYSPAAVWPVQAEGRIFIADPERALTAIDAETGRTLWRTRQSMVRESIGLSEDGQRLYAKTMQDSVVCYATDTPTPRQLWATNVGFGYEHAPSMLPEQDGIVYGSTRGGMIFALQGKTGQLLWRHHVGSSLVNTVVPVRGGIAFTTTEGHVGVVAPLPPTPSPK